MWILINPQDFGVNVDKQSSFTIGTGEDTVSGYKNGTVAGYFV
jgi:hypothetical protein